MKIDRFVKVMLVLIALLLAFNCAKDIILSSNSGESSSNLSSNSGSRNSTTSSNPSERNSSPSIFESSVEAQSKPTPLQVRKSQYKAVVAMAGALNDANGVQRALDQQSAEGWEYVGSVGVVLIFKK